MLDEMTESLINSIDYEHTDAQEKKYLNEGMKFSEQRPR